MEIQRLSIDEARRLRHIRLRALADTPDAFGSTYAEVAAHPLAEWSKQLQEIATFVAVHDGKDLGLVRCASDEHHHDTAWLISMWVTPEARGQGVGNALIDAVIECARSSGASRLLLDVGDYNQQAIALYARKGFQPNGQTGLLPAPRNHIREHQRELRL
ncbi:MAG TPA: GNAT family N-acetyltransferase [Anaerolineales bacterium]|nr:GNAT family N-acetyltransferase [Anaerolineales bacterium]